MKIELAVISAVTNGEKARLHAFLEVALSVGRREGFLGNNGNKDKKVGKKKEE